MNAPQSFDRIAADWLADGPSTLADRVLDAALAEIHVTAQRRPTPKPWRFLMSSRSAFFAAVAVVVVVAVLAAFAIGRSPGPAASSAGPPGTTAPSASAAASPAPIPSPSAEPPTPAPGAAFLGGPLAAGTYHSTAFVHPTVVLTVPDGWSRLLEDTEVLVLKRGDDVLAFTHQTTSVSDSGIKGLLCDYGGFNGPVPKSTAEPVTIGVASGFYGVDGACSTLFYDSGLRAYDAKGAVTAVWVVGVGQYPVLIIYDGSAATLADAKAILATLGQAP